MAGKYDDDSIMPFGVHKGKALANVPYNYLKWFWNENVNRFKSKVGSTLGAHQHNLMVYIEDNLDVLKIKS